MPQDGYTHALGIHLGTAKGSVFLRCLYMTSTVTSHFLSSTLIEAKRGSTASAVVNIHLEMLIIASSYPCFHLSCAISR